MGAQWQNKINSEQFFLNISSVAGSLVGFSFSNIALKCFSDIQYLLYMDLSVNVLWLIMNQADFNALRH